MTVETHHFAPGHEHDQRARHVGAFSACQYDACIAWRRREQRAAQLEQAEREQHAANLKASREGRR
jgi:hypothetical protein